MIHFRKLTEENIENLLPYFSDTGCGICDYTLPTLFMWRKRYGTEFAEHGGMLFIRHTALVTEPAYMLPIGRGNMKEALDALYASQGDSVSFSVVPEKDVEMFCAYLKERFGDDVRVEVSNDDDWSDYIYPSNMVGFPGKKLHGQKNHLNFFKKTYTDMRYIPLDVENAAVVAEFVRSQGVAEEADEIERAEYDGVTEFFEHYARFPMALGGFIIVDGRTVAATVGEICGEYLIIHIEKADRNYRGAYQAVFDMFLKSVLAEHEEILYINREEDCGDVGLRYSKQSYHPVRMLKKMTVSVLFT